MKTVSIAFHHNADVVGDALGNGSKTGFRNVASRTFKDHPYLTSYMNGLPNIADLIEANRELHGKTQEKTAGILPRTPLGIAAVGAGALLVANRLHKDKVKAKAEREASMAKQAILGDLAMAAAEGLEGMAGGGFASKAAAGLKGAASAVKGAVMAHPVRAAAVGGAAAGLAAGSAMNKQAEYDNMDKAAAVDYLMEQGVDFDSAVQAVSKAAAK